MREMVTTKAQAQAEAHAQAHEAQELQPKSRNGEKKMGERERERGGMVHGLLDIP